MIWSSLCCYNDFKLIVVFRIAGGLLTLSPQYCFVVEDKLGICGYLVGTADAKAFWRKYEISLLPELKEKYKKQSDEDEENLGEDVKVQIINYFIPPLQKKNY